MASSLADRTCPPPFPIAHCLGRAHHDDWDRVVDPGPNAAFISRSYLQEVRVRIDSYARSSTLVSHVGCCRVQSRATSEVSVDAKPPTPTRHAPAPNAAMRKVRCCLVHARSATHAPTQRVLRPDPHVRGEATPVEEGSGSSGASGGVAGRPGEGDCPGVSHQPSAGGRWEVLARYFRCCVCVLTCCHSWQHIATKLRKRTRSRRST